MLKKPQINSTFCCVVHTIVLAVVVCSLSEARIKEHELEQERLSGYKEHIIESQVYQRERVRSYRAYLENVEKDLFEKKQALKDFKKAQKNESDPTEDKNAFAEYLKEKKKDDKEMAAATDQYRKNQKQSKAIASQRTFTEEEELDIFVERPRYDYRKRAVYGAKPKYKIATKPGSSGSSSGGSGTYSPPPPDFGTDSGYIPPPPPPMPDMPSEPFYDEIPPPPPPPMPSEFGNDMGDGYIPPPPPPPPMFEGEF